METRAKPSKMQFLSIRRSVLTAVSGFTDESSIEDFLNEALAQDSEDLITDAHFKLKSKQIQRVADLKNLASEYEDLFDLLEEWGILGGPAIKIANAILPQDPATVKVKCLIHRAAPRLSVKTKLVEQALLQFTSLVNLALFANDEKLALKAYNMVEALPQTNTKSQLTADGFQLEGSVFNDNEKLLLGFEDTTPRLFKMLSLHETVRLKNLQSKDLHHKHIVEFQLRNYGRHCFFIMPVFPATLKQLLWLSENGRKRLVTQMCDALTHLHNQGVAHMDIKPSNICINHEGDFILIDLGSIVEFGSFSASTRAYIPYGFDDMTASADVDWWMLAATLSEYCAKDRLKWGAVSSRNPSKQELKEFLEKNLAAELWDLLSAKLKLD